MRVEAFRQRVMKYEDYHLSRQSLSEAVDFYLEQRPPDESGISACIQLANFVERSHLNRRAAKLWSPSNTATEPSAKGGSAGRFSTAAGLHLPAIAKLLNG
jgi:hypothetical protein